MEVGGQRDAPSALPPGKTPSPLYRRLGGSQGRSRQVREISSPTGIRSPDRPARSESLYRLSYPLYLVVYIVTTGPWRVTCLPVGPAEPHNTCSSPNPPALYSRNNAQGWCSTWRSTESRDLQANLSHTASSVRLSPCGTSPRPACMQWSALQHYDANLIAVRHCTWS
jgi:hypothetical protein